MTSESASLSTALATVEEHAGIDWINKAREKLMEVALANDTFIVDAIWDTGLSEPHEARAIGAVLVWGRNQGVIVPTERFIPSERAGCHRNPRRVWQSTIYQESGIETTE
jgi:hypothetical protein